MAQSDVEEIRQLGRDIREFPDKIHQAEIRVETMRDTWSAEKIKREYAYAGAFLKRKAMGESVDQAKMGALQDVYEIDKMCLIAESAYRRACADHKHLEDKFSAIRKMANLHEAAIMKLGTLVG